MVFNEARACTVESLTSEIQGKIPSKYKVRIHIGQFGVYAVIPEYEIAKDSDDGKKIAEVLKEYGPSAGNGWRIENNCARVIFLKGEQTAKWCEGEAPPPAKKDKLSLETFMSFDSSGKMVCNSVIKYDGALIDVTSPKNDFEKEIVASFLPVKTTDFDVECKDFVCSPKGDLKTGQVEVMVKAEGQVAHGKCDFFEADFETVSVHMEKGKSDEKNFCQATIKIQNKDKTKEVVLSELPESIGTFEWGSEGICKGLRCEIKADKLTANLSVKIKDKEYSSECSISSEEPGKDPEGLDIDEELDLDRPTKKFEYDPTKGGKAIQMPNPIPIPADNGWFMKGGMM